VAIAKEFPDTADKLIWSREEDQAHDFLPVRSRSASVGRLRPERRFSLACIESSGQSITPGSTRPHCRRQGPAASSRAGRGAGRCTDKFAPYTSTEPADRIRDAQHACSGRPAGAASTPTRTPSTWSDSSKNARGGGQRLRSSSRRGLMSKHPKHLWLFASPRKGDWRRIAASPFICADRAFMRPGSYCPNRLSRSTRKARCLGMLAHQPAANSSESLPPARAHSFVKHSM